MFWFFVCQYIFCSSLATGFEMAIGHPNEFETEQSFLSIAWRVL
jgi:hypothetical protein